MIGVVCLSNVLFAVPPDASADAENQISAAGELIETVTEGIVSAAAEIINASSANADAPAIEPASASADAPTIELISISKTAPLFSECPKPAVIIESCPDEPQKEKNQPEHKKGTLYGMVLVGSKADFHRAGVSSFFGVEINDLQIPGGAKNLKKLLENDFIGKPLNTELIKEIKHKIVSYYRKNNHPVILVDVPQQDVTNGTLQVVVVESAVGKVEFKGNEWFSSELLDSYVHLKPKDPINKKELMRDLAFMNRNPFRRTDVLFSAGEQEGTTNIDFITKDRLPFRIYAGADNTGMPQTDNARLFAGFNWGNAFGCDQLLTYQVTASPDFHRFLSNTIDYVAPLPWRHSVHIFGGYTTIHPKIQDFHSEGKSAQVSFRYDMPFYPNGEDYLNEFTLGFDYKYTNNDLQFLDFKFQDPLFGQVNVTQLVAGYSFSRKFPKNDFLLYSHVFYSPGEWLPHQTPHAFGSLRHGTNSHYVYGRFAFSDTYYLPKNFSIYGLARFQVSSAPLIPSEQFGLGGYDTVRGYEERQVNADNAVCVNLEIRSPKFSIFDSLLNKKVGDELTILVFGDYGYGVNNLHFFAEDKSATMASVGPGLRYRVNRYFSARLDIGFQLHHTRFHHNAESKVHVGAMLSY